MPLKHPVVGANPTAASIVGMKVSSSGRGVNGQLGFRPSSRCHFSVRIRSVAPRGLLAQGREHAVADRGIQVRLLGGLPLFMNYRDVQALVVDGANALADEAGALGDPCDATPPVEIAEGAEVLTPRRGFEEPVPRSSQVPFISLWHFLGMEWPNNRKHLKSGYSKSL